MEIILAKRLYYLITFTKSETDIDLLLPSLYGTVHCLESQSKDTTLPYFTFFPIFLNTCFPNSVEAEAMGCFPINFQDEEINLKVSHWQ